MESSEASETSPQLTGENEHEQAEQGSHVIDHALKLAPNIYMPRLCEYFSRKMGSLPSAIKPAELDKYVEFILKYPYLDSLSTLNEVVFAPDRVLNEKKRAKIERVLKQAENQKTLEMCVSQDIPKGYHFVVMPRYGDHKVIQDMMAKVPNCIKPEERGKVARTIQQDIDNGACVKIFGADNSGEPRAYFRYFITLDHQGRVLLQIDAVEGGDGSYWTKVREWAEHDRGKEIIYGMATSFYIADALNIDKIVLGDFESDEIGKMIGCSEVRVYDHDPMKRKIGILPMIVDGSGNVISEGAFVNRLGEGSSQRVLDMQNLRLLERLRSRSNHQNDHGLDNLSAEEYQRIESENARLERSVKKNPKKQMESELYHYCMEKLR